MRLMGTADFGRRRVDLAIIDARRNLSGVCMRWYTIILELHRFLYLPSSRGVVNHGNREGTAPDSLVCSAGALPKRCKLVDAMQKPCYVAWDHRLFGPRIVNAADGVCALAVFLLVSWLSGLLF